MPRPLSASAAKNLPSSLRICGESSGFELLADAAGAGDATGKKLKKFSMTAYTGGAMNVGFGVPVVVDLQGMQVPAQRLPILKDHNASQIAGHSESVEVTAQRIKLGGVMSGVGDAAQEVMALASNDFPWQCSIGASVQQLEYVDRGESVTVNGRSFTGPIYVARKTTLGEVSFVAMGADSSTSAKVAASQRGPTMFEEWVKGKGFDVATCTAEGKATLQAMYDAEQAAKNPPTPEPGKNVEAGKQTPAIDTTKLLTKDDITDILAKSRQEWDKQQAEREARLVAVRRVCKDHPEIEAKALAESWSAEKAELEVLRAGRYDGPFIAVHGQDNDCTLEALQGAMILRAGGRLDHPGYRSETGRVALEDPALKGKAAWLRADDKNEKRLRAMDLAHRYSSISAVDLCRHAMRLDGKTAISSYSKQDLIRAAFSGSTLTNIFTTNVNAILIATYLEAPDTTEAWTQETEVNDFKTNDEIQLAKGGGLAPLPRGRSAEHTNRSDRVESYKVGRYAKQFVLDEQDMIDDRLDAFSDVPVEMGLAAARLRPDLVYAIVLANPTLNQTSRALFNATDANLKTTSALTSTTLKTAITAMMTFQDNGVNLNISPTHILVPTALVFTAGELLQSAAIIIAGTAGSVTERGTKNVLEGMLSPVSDPRLDNGVTDPKTGTVYSGSGTTWYLVSQNVRTIKVAYLAGSGRGPQARSFQLSEGQWGMGWDVKMDVGAAAMDWRGLVKNTA